MSRDVMWVGDCFELLTRFPEHPRVDMCQALERIRSGDGHEDSEVLKIIGAITVERVSVVDQGLSYDAFFTQVAAGLCVLVIRQVPLESEGDDLVTLIRTRLGDASLVEVELFDNMVGG